MSVYVRRRRSRRIAPCWSACAFDTACRQLWLEELADEDIGAQNRTGLSEFLDKAGEAGGQQHIDRFIKTCRLGKADDEGSAKLTFAIVDNPQLRSTVTKAMEQLGVKHFEGPAPPGYVEGQLSVWLSALQLK